MRRKHRNDKKHGKDGWVGGKRGSKDRQYRRSRKTESRKDVTMKGLGSK